MQDTGLSDGPRPKLSRRQFTAAIPALLAAPSILAQPSGLKLRKLNCFELRVSDVAVSVKFYQGLFGMPVQARQGDRVCLRIGDGPQFMAIRALLPGETPAITQIGYSVEDYGTDRVLEALGGIGFELIEAPPASDPGIEHAMKTWVRQRGKTPELYFADARGLIVQLSAVDYCGGAGETGNECPRPEPVPAGLMRLSDISHFTAFVSNGNEANQFYQETFGLEVQAYQGAQSPVTGIGDGRQFVMYAGGFGRGGQATPASINHGCFNMYEFDVEGVLATLTKYGLSARGDARTGPLMHYVSLRMPNRGGAEGGTPELYFTDPDGILMQLQDITYCGGGGYLGNECLSA